MWKCNILLSDATKHTLKCLMWINDVLCSRACGVSGRYLWCNGGLWWCCCSRVYGVINIDLWKFVLTIPRQNVPTRVNSFIIIEVIALKSFYNPAIKEHSIIFENKHSISFSVAQVADDTTHCSIVMFFVGIIWGQKCVHFYFNKMSLEV